MGLKDVATNTQLFENEKYIRVLRNVCYSYKAPFSFNVLEGGYIYESGEYARETSLVLTLIVVEKAVVNDMEYVMITKNKYEHILSMKHWNPAASSYRMKTEEHPQRRSPGDSLSKKALTGCGEEAKLPLRLSFSLSARFRVWFKSISPHRRSQHRTPPYCPVRDRPDGGALLCGCRSRNQY